jgi:hypothetical protein
VVIGQPGLINPLLSGLTLILIGLILQELNLSRWWVLLFLLSPFVLIMSSSMMSHPAALFWGTAGLWFFLKAQREKPGLLFLWGLCAGLMFSTRPFTAVCFNLPLALFALRKRVGLGILTAGLGAILGSLPYFISNYFTTGSIFSVGYQAAWDGYSGLFFGASPWGPPHTPQFGVVHLATLLYGLNSYLFQIPLPALIGVVLWLMFQKNKNWKEWMVLSAGLCEIGGYYFYFYVDMAYGPRFAYCSVVPLLLISASGLKGFYRYLRDKGISKEMLQKSFFLASIILLALWGTISLPAQESYYFHRYSDVDPDFGKFIEANRISNALVFLDDYPSTDRHARLYSLGFSNRQAWFYSWRLSDEAIKLALKGVGIEAEDGYGAILSVPSLARALNQFWGDMRYLPSPREDMDRPYIPLKQGYIYMSPYIERNDIIYARNLGRHNEKLMEKFPQRRYYRVELTKKGYILSEIRSKIK